MPLRYMPFQNKFHIVLKRVFCLSLLFSCHLCLPGQVTHEIKEVIVEGKAEKDALTRMKEAGPMSLVISSRELANLGHNTAGDVLKRLPRIVVQGPPSFYRNIMMGGLDKEFQCVLINGNRPGGGEDYRDFKLDRIPVGMIERIEVVYNPPASMGADAPMGAVDITLKDDPGGRLIAADLSADRTSTQRALNPEAGMSYGNRWGKWSVLGNFNLNNFQRKNLASLKDTAVQGTEEEDLDVLIAGMTGSVAFSPDSVSRWKLQSAYSHYREDLVFLGDVSRRTQGGLSERYDSSDDEKNRIFHSHTLSYSRLKGGSEWITGITMSQHFDRKDKYRTRENSSGMEFSYEDEDQKNSDLIIKSGYKLKTTGTGFSNLLKAGFRLSALNRVYDRRVYTKITDHMFWDNIEDGSYILNEFRAGAWVAEEMTVGKFWVSPAVRLDLDRGNYTTASDWSGNVDYVSLNPSLHTKIHLNDDLFLKADMARQISRPPFNMMVPVQKIKSKKQVIEQGNSGLVPSRAWTSGMGMEKYFNDKGFIALRGFYSVLRDVIEVREIGIDESYGYRILQSVNIDSGRVWGLDLSARYDLLSTNRNDLAFSGNISWLGSEVRDPVTLKLRRLNEQPQYIFNASLDYLNVRLRIKCSIGFNHISERITASATDEVSGSNTLLQDPFSQWDARIKYYFSSWGSVYINCINLLNETTDLTQGTVNESHTIGRNIVLGVSMVL